MKKIQPFFNLSFKSLEDIVSIGLGIFVISIVILRAYTTDISYDEAYTYMNTGRIQDVWKMYQFKIANTHILNSLMMTISTLLLPYNDFAIRLPNVIMSIIYVGIAFSITKNYKNRLLAFGILTLFHFMLEFMAQGRGYGMSATFVLATLFVFQSKDKFSNYHLWMAYLSILAFYANYVAIAPVAAIGIYLFFTDFKRSIPKTAKRHKRWIIGLTVLGLYGFFSVTLKGKPLYGAYNSNILEAISSEYIELFWPGLGITTLTAGMVTIGFALLIIALSLFKKKMPFGIIALLTFSIIALMAFVGNKPLPTGRVLIPFWPLVALAIIEQIEKTTLLVGVSPTLLRTLNFVLVIPLVLNIGNQINANELMAAKAEQWKRPIKSLSSYGKSVDPDDIYYIQKDNRHGIISKKIEAHSFEKTSFDKLNVKNYKQLKLMEIEWLNRQSDSKLYRQISSNKQLIYGDTIVTDPNTTLFQETTEGMKLILPYPNISSGLLKVGGLSRDWETLIEIKN